MGTTKFSCEIEKQVAYISVFEEEERKPCTLDWDSLAMLENIIDQLKSDNTVRAAVIQSKSPKSFVVGANIAVLETLNSKNIIDWVKNGHRIFGKIQELPFPVIAKVEHYALGGGLELAMSCDMIIASEEAVFAQPEASLGVMPGWGGTGRLAKLIGPNRAKEMFFTGRQITAAQAYEWGLVNHVYPADKIDEGLQQILDDILKNDAQVIHLSKEIVNGHTQEHMKRNALEEAYTSSVCMSSETTLERLKNFFDSRKKRHKN